MGDRPSPGRNITPMQLLSSCWSILSGHPPMLSIEITRECPLSCPGCYAYGAQHLGTGAPTLRDLSDLRGDALVNGVLDLVRAHRPLHVSLVGGEPLVRHRELGRILPALGKMRINILLVTSAVIPIPQSWMSIPGLRVAVSVDGLPEHHDVRRAPATYERILRNMQRCAVNIHWTITRPMLNRSSYLEEYLAFWNAREEVNRIWASIYSPQVGEHADEIPTAKERRSAVGRLLLLKQRYPKLLMNRGLAAAYLKPPESPRQCLFSRMSQNYSADLRTRVEPCVLGGNPDCSKCGCVASVGLHWIKSVQLAPLLKIEHVARASMAVGRAVRRLRTTRPALARWQPATAADPNTSLEPSNGTVDESELVQIAVPESSVPHDHTQP